jgi:class 3 adenylate cyclase
VLVDGLGIEPGAELRALEQAILRQDEALAAPERPAMPAEPPPARAPVDERKVVTALFADLVGSTELMASTDPERSRATLTRFFEAMADEVELAGGTLEKFVGDAVMAVFGAPVAQEDHAERALHTALAMRRRVKEEFAGELELRIGVATGEVVIGAARAGGSFATGPAVNAAARLEESAAPGEILVLERTARAVGGAFEFCDTRTVAVKGMPEQLECRTFGCALGITQPRGGGHLAAAFVGRDGELQTLRGAYRRAVDERRPFLVSVVGDAGVGKSRLVRELWEWLAAQSPEPVRRTSRCYPLGKRITHAPLRDLLREDVALARPEERDVLGLALGLDGHSGVHPLAARDRLRQAWTGLLEQLARERPVVLLVEDLHWAQDLLVELLEAAVREVAAPVLVVATARPELHESWPGWGRGRDSTTIWLDPLSNEETEVLLEQLLGEEVPEELRQTLVERVEGNPFFAEELLEGLVDEGVLARLDGGWRLLCTPAELAVPDSVQSVLAARIDLLPPTEKAALQAASAVGRVFWRGAVRNLLAGEVPDFALLEARDFIRRRSTSSVEGERELVFKHALTRDVAYASVPKTRRAKLHAACAAWFESVGEPSRSAAQLAYHYSEAVRPEDADLAWAGEEAERERLEARAVEWLSHAADGAIARYELDEAIALLRRALELAPSDRIWAVWLQIGRAAGLKFDAEAFWTSMHEAIEAAPTDAIKAQVSADLAFETLMRSGMWRTRPGTELVGPAIERALAFAERSSPARAKALVAQAFLSPDLHGPSREAHAIAERLDDPLLLSYALDAERAVAVNDGDYERAWAVSLERVELLNRITDPDAQADVFQTLVGLAVATGHFERASEFARRHDEIARGLTPHHDVHAVAGLVELRELLGHWDELRSLEERLRTAVAANVETQCTQAARSLLVCAIGAECLGDHEGAARLEAEADALGLPGRHVLDAPRLRLALLRGDLDRANELLDTLLTGVGWYGRGHWTAFATLLTKIEAAGVLGRRDLFEALTERLVRPGPYLSLLIQRADGLLRGDAGALDAAAEGFARLGLDWHADQTAELVGSARVA